MKTPPSSRHRGFTLLETVIAIGVLAVLLTGFMYVFAPAAAGIRKSINVQEADRLTSTLEQELVTPRGTQPTPGFTKAFELIKKSTTNPNDALLVYQYRGSLTNLRSDSTPEPIPNVNDKMPGKDYTVQTMVRLRSDAKFTEDLPAVEGGVYLVKCTQLIFDTTSGAIKLGTAGQIQDPKKGGADTNVNDYPEAVIAFAADFYTLPAKSKTYFDSKFSDTFTKVKNPVFSRNLAVRR